MAVRIKIADTYKRKVKIPLPGAGLKPEEHEITVIYRDIDPDKIQTEQDKLAGFIKQLNEMLESLKKGDPDSEQIEAAQEQLSGAEDIEAKIDMILVGVEGLEVVGKDDELLEGDELLNFCKRYPRIKNAILKNYNEENEGADTAALGNLMRSAGRGRA